MSEFKSYTDCEGKKVRIGDLVEVLSGQGKDVKRTGRIAKITNETFSVLTVVLDDGSFGHIPAKRTRKLDNRK